MTPLENINKVIKETQKVVAHERKQSIFVSILGQTGCGKTSLINKLFGVNFKTHSVRPCTQDIQEHSERVGSGGTIVFYDLPGIGENPEADEGHFKKYVEAVQKSNVVLWAVHADTRSTTFDKNSLKHLLSLLSEEEGNKLLNKLIIILTKSDLLFPEPWILSHTKEEIRLFPQSGTKNLFEDKAYFFLEELLEEFSPKITSEAICSDGFSVKDERFKVQDGIVSFQGILSRAEVESLTNKYPKYASVFQDLHDLYKPVPCSSYFGFNLEKLMYVIVNRLDFSGLQRFHSFVENYKPPQLTFEDSTGLCNMLVHNKNQDSVIFSLKDYIGSQLTANE